MKTENKEITEGLNRIREAGKSMASGILAMAAAAKQAAQAVNEFRVACYPVIPSEDHPMVKQMRAIAEAEGKKLVLVNYPRHIPDKVFGQTYIVYDEYASLDWLTRHVVNWRGKKMVYHREILLSRN